MRQPRTPDCRRWPNQRLRGATVFSAAEDVQDEVRRLGGRDLVISSNLRVRADGLPRSDQRKPDDPGVAVYFARGGKALVFACDKYDRPEHNLRAIAMHLDALRGMERWGVGTLDQAFAGYEALPENASVEAWWSVLGLAEPPRTDVELKAAHREAVRRAHPDTGGSQEAFVRVQRAFEEGQAVLGGVP
jgi:hypothetical protein